MVDYTDVDALVLNGRFHVRTPPLNMFLDNTVIYNSTGTKTQPQSLSLLFPFCPDLILCFVQNSSKTY